MSEEHGNGFVVDPREASWYKVLEVVEAGVCQEVRVYWCWSGYQIGGRIGLCSDHDVKFGKVESHSPAEPVLGVVFVERHFAFRIVAHFVDHPCHSKESMGYILDSEFIRIGLGI